jgi:hypothetical protein
MKAMSLLRRTLYSMAAVWAASGIAIAAVPRWVLVNVFDQAPYPDYAYVRVAGVVSFSSALLMVVTAQRLEDMWVYAWAFVIAAVGTFAIALANAAWGRPDASSAVLWWLFAAVSLLFTIGLLVGLAKTGSERPAV